MALPATTRKQWWPVLFCSSMEVHMVAGKKDEQLRFQARLLDAVGQSVIATDLEGKVLYWNRAAEEIYGWSSEEALGRRLRDLTVSEGSLEKAEEVGSELRAGRAWSGETLLRRKDGSYVPVLGTATPLFDDRGNLVGMIGVSTDISERKALEEQLHHQAFHDPLTGSAEPGVVHGSPRTRLQSVPIGGAPRSRCCSWTWTTSRS